MRERYIKAVSETGPGVAMFMDVGGSGTYPVARIVSETGPGVELGVFVNDSGPGVELVNVVSGHELIRAGRPTRREMTQAQAQVLGADLTSTQHRVLQELDEAFAELNAKRGDLAACRRVRDIVDRGLDEAWPNAVWLEDVIRQGVFAMHVMVQTHGAHAEALPTVRALFGPIRENRWMDGGPQGRLRSQDARECSRLIAVCEANLPEAAPPAAERRPRSRPPADRPALSPPNAAGRGTSRLPPGEKIALIAGVLLIVDLLFAPWHSIDLGSLGDDVRLSGVQSPNALYGVGALILTLVIVGQIIVAKLTSVVPDLPVPWARAHVVAGSAVAVLLVAKLIVETGSLGFGAYAGVLGGLALAYGGYRIATQPDALPRRASGAERPPRDPGSVQPTERTPRRDGRVGSPSRGTSAQAVANHVDALQRTLPSQQLQWAIGGTLMLDFATARMRSEHDGAIAATADHLHFFRDSRRGSAHESLRLDAVDRAEIVTAKLSADVVADVVVLHRNDGHAAWGLLSDAPQLQFACDQLADRGLVFR